MKKKINFINIINNLSPKDIVFKDNFVIAFNDKNPLTPIHILIVTNKVIPTINDIEEKDEKLIGHCFTIASKIAKLKKISNSGYRLISNCNFDSGQEIFHFHIHLLGGRYLGKIIC